MSLVEDLAIEMAKATRGRPCSMCDAIRALGPGVVKDALRDAAAGTLSERALHRVTTKNAMGVGRRAITRHREEGHTP